MNNYHQLTTHELICQLEKTSIFDAYELETELNRRLEITGKRWRFNIENKIELYYPPKKRPEQKPCDIGLFDLEGRKQTDIANLLFSSTDCYAASKR